MEWMVSHRNVAAILTFGESDNLIVAPTSSGRLSTAKQIDLVEFANSSISAANRVGMIAAGGLRGFGRGGGEFIVITEEMIREFTGGGRGGQTTATQPTSARAMMPARAPATTVNTSDIDYFRTIAGKYIELTGIRQQPLVVKPEGAFFQYGYFQFGVPSFSTPGWGLPEAPRGQGMPGRSEMPGGQPPAASGQAQAAQMQSQFAAMMGQRGGGGGRGGTQAPTGMAAGEAGAQEAQGIDRQLLQWMDKEKIDGFVAWTKFKHPDLGDIEIGGFKAYATVNPPAAKIADLGKTHAEFAVYLPSLFPKIGIAKLEAINHGGGIFRIKAEVENAGFLPTSLAHGVTARAVKPTMVQLQVPPESIISGNAKTNNIQTLAGSGDRAKYEWLIKAKVGDTIELKVVSQKAGTDRRSVTLK
jgi:hypothetical protein